MKYKKTINYNNCLNYLNNLNEFSGAPSLITINKVLNSLDNVQNRLNVVHIAGTNGKGSVTTILRNIYQSAGYKVGTFTSPHVIRVNEMVTVNGKEITSQDFTKFFNIILTCCDKANVSLSQFEFITALSLLYLYESKVDIAIIETGIGSVSDATNVFDKKLAMVYTSIDLDHTCFLGESTQLIAKEKSNLIKGSEHVIISNNTRTITGILKDKSKQEKAIVHDCSDYKIKSVSHDLDGQDFMISKASNEISGRTSILGDHQLNNILTSFVTARALKRVYPIHDEQILSGIKNATLTLRCDYLPEKNVLLDSAHNPAGIKALAKVIDDYCKDKKIITVFGVLKDKNYQEMLRVVKRFSDELIVTKPVSPRAHDFQKIDGAFYKDSYKEALTLAFRMKKENRLIVVCGSFYLTAHAKTYIEKYPLN